MNLPALVNTACLPPPTEILRMTHFTKRSQFLDIRELCGNAGSTTQGPASRRVADSGCPGRSFDPLNQHARLSQ